MPTVDLSKYNQEQVKAITWSYEPNTPIFVSAGAGTGKTSVLTTRIQYLISKGIAPKNILAITFTRLAAKEMRERLCAALPRKLHSELSIRTFHSLACHLLPPFSYVEKAKRSMDKARQDENREEPEFSKMIPKVLCYLKDNPQICTTLQCRFQHILVDEFQDTSPEQWVLLTRLLPPYHNLFAVGDEDQSIYRFRGASPDIIKKVHSTYPHLAYLKLQENYRSTSRILEYANTLFPEKTKETKKLLCSGSSRTDALFANNSPVYIDIQKDAMEQVQFLAQEMLRLQKSFSILWSDFAILVRLQHQKTFYLEWFSKNIPEAASTINICTIHSSKGLQYPVVFLVGLNNGLFPHFKRNALRASEKKQHYLEEKRLLYVGITRAESLLYLCSCTEYYIYGKKKKASMNSFLWHYGPWKQRLICRWNALRNLL
jgi:superfamily I DNA/RNA helicase